MDVTDSQGITKRVQLLETIANRFAEAYRTDLETELGDGFLLGKLTRYEWANEPEDHFYELHHDNGRFGIILPIAKQAFIGNRNNDHSALATATGVLERRGYSVFEDVNDTYNLVRIAKEKRRITSS